MKAAGRSVRTRHETGLIELATRKYLENHGDMICVLVDDLFFSIKI